MARPYKLKDEIEQFIIAKKKANPKFSCRKIVPLIKEHFKIDLSKSTINAIIKENSLSSKVGRTRVRLKAVGKPAEKKVALASEPQLPASPVVGPVFEAANFASPVLLSPRIEENAAIVPLPGPQPIEFRTVAEQSVDIVNGAAIFLLMVDYKFGLSEFLSQKISAQLPDLPKETIRFLIQAGVYGQVVKDNPSLEKFLGKEIISGNAEFYCEQLAKIPFDQLNEEFVSLGLTRNISDLNGLYKESLLFLNRQVQRSFLPSVYQFLDFSAMRDRFYSLVARIERTEAGITVYILYPLGFKAINDIVWQDDFKSVISSINKERVFAPDGRLFRFEETLEAYK
jgi:hypothetical protein